jgi:predicted RNA-binding protein associated with RNAse of E/G family
MVKEKTSIGKIKSIKDYVDVLYSGYIIETNKGKYFLPDSQLDYDILKTLDINKDGVKFFYIDVIKRNRIEDDYILPLEILIEIYNTTDNKNIIRDIYNLYKKLRSEH